MTTWKINDRVVLAEHDGSFVHGTVTSVDETGNWPIVAFDDGEVLAVRPDALRHERHEFEAVEFVREAVKVYHQYTGEIYVTAAFASDSNHLNIRLSDGSYLAVTVTRKGIQ